MALTDTAIRQAKTGIVDRKMADEKGLSLLVTASGSKLWRFKYRLSGKEKKLALGSYPEVGLKEARERHDTARCLIPRFDGAILSLEWKEAIWDRFVTGAPRPRTSSEQQYSDRKLRSRR